MKKKIPDKINMAIDKFIKETNAMFGNRVKKNYTLWFLCTW